MKITPVSEHVGAEVSEIDIRRLTDGDTATLLQAWGQHGVLFFRDQELTPDDHITFAERFAPIDVNKFFQPVETHPQIAQVLKEPDQLGNIGGGWHTDHSYDQIPAKGSILLAREVPPEGGDTRFLSVAAAYDALSDGLKATLETLSAHHTNVHIFGAGSKHMDKADNRLQNPENVGSAIHPVVIKHPTTGQKLLYVNLAFTTRLISADGHEWTEEESRPLIDYLLGHTAEGGFDYQFSWDEGSLAMWDNRSTWHWALNDYQGHRRLMHRITIAGEALSAAAS